MRAKLYSLSLSHPSQAARLMLERKGIEHEVADLLPAFHPILLRLAGFRGGTVPALRIDGRRVQGSLSISRALEAIQPEPSLFSLEAERRRAVEEAEAWASVSSSRYRGASSAGLWSTAWSCAGGSREPRGCRRQA